MGIWLHPSAIGSFEYCEFQFYLTKKMNWPKKKTRAMHIGTQIHAQLEATTPTSPLPLPENLAPALSGEIPRIVKREFHIRSERLQMIGQIDEVWVEKGGVVIIDDKPGRVNNGHKLQVLAYALMFKDVFGDVPIVVMIRDRDTGEAKWEDTFNEDNEKWIKDTLARMRAILSDEIKPKPTDNLRKCEVCSVNYACDIYQTRKQYAH